MEELKESACEYEAAFELAFGFVPSLVARAACELGVPDMLAREPLTARQIAQKLQARSLPATPCDSNAAVLKAQKQVEVRAELVERMMRFLSSRGIFQAVQAGSGGGGAATTLYSLTPLSAWLVQSDSPKSMLHMLLVQTSKQLMAPWHYLSQAILAADLDDVAPMNSAYGTDVWSLASVNTGLSNVFNAAMSSSSHLSLLAFLAHYRGLEQIHTLVDVGGGNGTAASYIAARYPSIKAINFDLPRVVALAPVYPGVEHIGGDMFESIPPGDAIFMKWVLHDWGDEDCIKILKNCYKALPTHGKVIIMDAILEDDCSREHPFSKLQVTMDMVMMVHTTKGKERTKEQWKCLLQAANFYDLKFYDVPCPQNIIEASISHVP